jgi:putative salt-induced outer membrane protein
MKLKVLTIILCPTLLCAASAFGQAAAGVTNAPPTDPPWDLSAAAGLTLTRGNSHTTLFTGNVLADKKWDAGKNELSLGVDGVYGTDHGVENANSLHGFVQYNHLFTERFYGYARVDGLHDAIAGIDYRVTVSPGVGYYFIKETNTFFRGEVGPGYLYEKDNDDTTHSYATLRLAERFEHTFNQFVKVWESVEYLPQVDRFGNYIVNSEIGVETTMSKKLALQVYLQDNYHSEPPDDRLKNDLKLVSAIKYKF